MGTTLLAVVVAVVDAAAAGGGGGVCQDAPDNEDWNGCPAGDAPTELWADIIGMVAGLG